VVVGVYSKSLLGEKEEKTRGRMEEKGCV